jgi:hypothetical protein
MAAYLPQNFESHRDAVYRRRLNRQVLRAGDRQARRLRHRLRACQPGNRCGSEACKVCVRTFRRQYLSAASPVFASRPDWTRVSIIPSGFAIPVGQLSSVDLEKIGKHARKRLERTPHLRDRIVIGGIDVSLNQQNNSVGHWQLHLYLLIEGKKTSKFTAAVKAAFPPEPTAARPYRFRAVDDFAAAASYAYKSIFTRRSAYLKDGKPRTRSLPLKRQYEAELLSWLGGYKVGVRLILRGVRRNGSPIQLQPSKAKP